MHLYLYVVSGCRYDAEHSDCLWNRERDVTRFGLSGTCYLEHSSNYFSAWHIQHPCSNMEIGYRDNSLLSTMERFFGKVIKSKSEEKIESKIGDKQTCFSAAKSGIHNIYRMQFFFTIYSFLLFLLSTVTVLTIWFCTEKEH